MKLEQRTIQILKNFSAINPSLLFKAGSTLTTLAPSHTVFATATVKEEFPCDFAIYDLARLLSIMSMFDDTMDIKDGYLLLGDKNKSVKYVCSKPEHIVTPEKEYKLKKADDSFPITKEHLSTVMKATGLLQLPEFAFVGDGKTVSIQALDSKNPTGDVCTVGVAFRKEKFKVVFDTENINKILLDEYVAELSLNGMVKFTNKDLSYLIAASASGEKK
jgi:hypothetical protein